MKNMAAETMKECNKVVNLDLIHARLGHVSVSKMQHLSFLQM